VGTEKPSWDFLARCCATLKELSGTDGHETGNEAAAGRCILLALSVMCCNRDNCCHWRWFRDSGPEVSYWARTSPRPKHLQRGAPGGLPTHPMTPLTLCIPPSDPSPGTSENVPPFSNRGCWVAILQSDVSTKRRLSQKATPGPQSPPISLLLACCGSRLTTVYPRMR
jgi:hypothetical protein